MKRLMRYKIISGRVVEKRDVLMDISLDPTTNKPRPRGKRKGKMVAAQIERNFREAMKRLARILNCNCKGGDLFLSLKYDDTRLPATREEAERIAGNFMRRICRAYRKQTGEKLMWVLVTADRSTKTGKPVRLHHHVVMSAVDWELISEHWPSDQFSYRRLDSSGDYTGIAKYMLQNAGYERGKRSWRSCQGLEKPVFTSPEPVKGAGSFRVPKEARIVERSVREDEESGFYSAYIRYVMPEGKESTEEEFLDPTRRAHPGTSCAGTSNAPKRGQRGGGG